MVLLLNKSEIEFITSDSPVVFFNTVFSNDAFHNSLGYASKGLQVFYPISPKIMVMLFDSDLYSVAKDKNYNVEITDSKDIRRLNGLQLLFCSRNAYYCDYDVNDLKKQHMEIGHKRISPGIVELIRSKSYRKGAYLKYTRINPQYNLIKLSFVNSVNRGQVKSGVRNPEFVKKYEIMMRNYRNSLAVKP